MRARRANPWPAVTDLFAALMVAALAAYAIASADLAIALGERLQDNDVLAEMQRIRNELMKALVEKNAPPGWTPDVENCVFDACVPVNIVFETSKAGLLPEGVARVRELCTAYSETVKRLNILGEVVLVIEGHTDPTLPSKLEPEDRDRYNWDLSGRRATSVLRAFNACGVREDAGFQTSAGGYADTRPVTRLDGEDEAGWYKRRRRTTLRIRVNQDLVRERLLRQRGQ